MIEANKVTTHETVWSGTITGPQLEELLIKALRDELGTPSCGMRLNVGLVVEASVERGLPTIHYELVHDHDWILRPEIMTRCDR